MRRAAVLLVLLALVALIGGVRGPGSAAPIRGDTIFVGLDAFAVAPGPHGLVAVVTKASFVALVSALNNSLVALSHPGVFESPPGSALWTDKGLLITYSDTGDVLMYDAFTGRVKWSLKGVGGGATGKACLLNNSYAAVAEGKELWVINIDEGYVAARYRFTQEINDVSASPRGDPVAIAGRSNLAIFSLRENRTLYNDTSTIRAVVSRVAWSPGGEWIAVSGIIAGTEDFRARIYLYSAGSGVYQPIWTAEQRGDNTGLAWSGDERFILADHGESLGVFDAYSGRLLRDIRVDGDIYEVKAVGDKAYLATSYGLLEADIGGGSSSARLVYGGLGSHAYSPRLLGDKVVFAVLRYKPSSYIPRHVSYVAMYSVEGERIWVSRQIPGMVMDLEIRGNTVIAAYASYRENSVFQAHVAYIDLGNGSIIGDTTLYSGEAQGYAYTYLDISPDAEKLLVVVSGSQGSTVTIYSLGTGEPVARRTYSSKVSGMIQAAAWSPDSEKIAVVSTKRIAVLDASTAGEIAWRENQHPNPNAKWSIDGGHIGVIASYRDPRTGEYIDLIYLYRARDLELETSQGAPQIMSGHRLSKLLYLNHTLAAVGVEDRLEIMDASTAQVLYTEKHRGVVIDAYPAGDRIAVTTGDYGTVVIEQKPRAEKPLQPRGGEAGAGETPWWPLYAAVPAAAAIAIAAYLAVKKK